MRNRLLISIVERALNTIQKLTLTIEQLKDALPSVAEKKQKSDEWVRTVDHQEKIDKERNAALRALTTEIQAVKADIKQYASDYKPYHPKIQFWTALLTLGVFALGTGAAIQSLDQLKKSVVAANDQAQTARTQAQVAQTAMEIAYRSYVAVPRIEFFLTKLERMPNGLNREQVLGEPKAVGRRLQAGDFPIAQLTVANSGTTPASNVRVYGVMVLSPGLPDDQTRVIKEGDIVKQYEGSSQGWNNTCHSAL